MLTIKEYNDKVLGGWMGKCAGGILGAPIEGYKCFNEIPLSDELFETNFCNDDLDLQILWLDMVLKKGNKIRPSDFREHWKNHVDFPWNEYGIATRNIRVGLDHPDTGSHNNTYWNASMGSPIRSELWGMLCAGNPEKAAYFARMDSRLDHCGFSDDAEAYQAACEAIAFTMTDIPAILLEGLKYIDQDCLTYKMVKNVFSWYEKFGVEATKGRIKSAYGDADFTSAPMNVAFTVLSLLDSKGDFDKLIEALHYGHDSDCIVATAGSILGIVRGASEIPALWKKRIGNELMVSPEITGIDCPKTITELTDLTCKAAQLFQGPHTVVDFSTEEKFTVENDTPFALFTKVLAFPDFEAEAKGAIAVHIENLSPSAKSFTFNISSPAFPTVQPAGVTIQEDESVVVNFEFTINEDFQPFASAVPYTVEVTMDELFKFEFERGLPYYGQWLMMGPFMRDDASLAPMHKQYPDHGLASMPSATYMNHDLQKPAEDFLAKVKTPWHTPAIFEQDFIAQVIQPAGLEVDLKKYFYGIGERTVYLSTEISSATALKKWLCIGTSNFVTVSLNGKTLHQNEQLKRRWPSTEIVELPLEQGTNTLLVRFDFINDDFKVSLGLKEHHDRHPHQTQWETELNFSLPQQVVEAYKELV